LPQSAAVPLCQNAGTAAALAGISQLIAQFNAGRHPHVEARARELLDQYPNSGQLWELLAASLTMQGKDALQALERTAQLLPDNAPAHSNLGNALRELGRLGAAAACYRRTIELAPDDAAAHNNLGGALRALGRLDEAVASYRRALAIRSDYAEAYNNLGNVLLDLGQPAEAEASYRRALEFKPDYGTVHGNLGKALQWLGRLDEAAASYRRALTLAPEDAEAHNQLGITLRLLNRTAEAQASCRRALAIHPDFAAAMVLLADLHADQGQFAEAEALFKRALSIEPELPQAWAGIAHLRKMTCEDADWSEQAQRIADANLPPQQELYLRYALGKYFDDVRDFDQAFVNFKRANELTGGLLSPFDRGNLTRAVDQISQGYDRRWLRQACIAANESARAVFIVGMPRSGTSLAEQILASHPAIHGAGELTFWKAASATYQSCASSRDTSAGILSRLADDYLCLLQDLSPGARRVVDKMPANVLFLGLIHAALPEARIIHMRRNPIDTCLSIYFQHFETPHPYAHDLQDLAHYYREYLRLMKHWRSTLPPEAILEVPYEGMVADHEAWGRTMLEFIGLPWHPQCLDFHLTSRTVMTASKWQVRQRISKSSVGRWRNYQKFVGPLLNLDSDANA
jgi:tetratricopeptide (TPR) repeat protein